jgi:hypothetical protein
MEYNTFCFTKDKFVSVLHKRHTLSTWGAVEVQLLAPLILNLDSQCR